MKLYEIASGEKEEILDSIVPMITKNCKRALHCMRATHGFLFRGIKAGQAKALPRVFLGASRDNRNPTSSSATFQRNIDLTLSNAGFNALRLNSIFVTSNIHEASLYSSQNLYMIFPIDGFKFTWSPVISDLYINEWKMWGDDDIAFNTRQEFYNHENASPELQKRFLEITRYTDTDFTSAMKSGNEIMISGRYYAVTSKYKDYPEFRALIGE